MALPHNGWKEKRSISHSISNVGFRNRPELARAVAELLKPIWRCSPGCPAFTAYTVIETIFKSFTACFPFKRSIIMAGRTPEWTRALVIKKCSAEAKPVYHDAVLETRPLQQLKHGEVLVKMSAVSFNRREVSITLLQWGTPSHCSSKHLDSFGYALVNTRELSLGAPLALMEQVI
jgi:hypothetical protein